MKSRKEEFLIDLINKMFEIAGHDVKYEDIVDRRDGWYSKCTMTSEQNDEGVKYGEALIKKVFGYPKKICHREMMWLNMMYGLKIKNDE